MLDDAGHQDGQHPETSAASLYALYPPQDAEPNPAGQWNEAKIVARGNLVEHWLNSKKVVACELHSDDWNRRVAESKFKDWAQFAHNRSGHIALQDHGDLVWYRNITIEPLVEQ